MNITFTGGYTYRFSYRNGSYKDLVQAGDNGADTLWRDAKDVLHTGSSIFPNVVAIREIAHPPRASNEQP